MADESEDWYACDDCGEVIPESRMMEDLDICKACAGEEEPAKPDNYICEECDGKFPESRMQETLDICVYCAKSLETQRTNIVPFGTLEWNDRMALDLALILEGCGDTVDDLLKHYRMHKNDLRRFSQDKIFNMRVSHFRREIATEGLGFRMKARVQAEELLRTSWNLIHDPSTSANVKADLIKSTVKWAGLEPKPDALEAGGGSGGAGVRININLGNANQPVSVQSTGDTYDHDDAPAIAEQ